MRGKFPFTPRSAFRYFSPGCEGNPHGWLQAPESKFLEQTQDSRALKCENLEKRAFQFWLVDTAQWMFPVSICRLEQSC